MFYFKFVFFDTLSKVLASFDGILQGFAHSPFVLQAVERYWELSDRLSGCDNRRHYCSKHRLVCGGFFDAVRKAHLA